MKSLSNVAFNLGFSILLLSSGTTAIPRAKSKLNLDARTDLSPGVELRIQPLGDSITHGYLSSDDGGYRSRLLTLASGTHLQFVGSVQNGNTMPFNESWHEGHDGKVIDEIAEYAKLSLPDRPNLILVHAGTNDMRQPTGQPYCVSDCPDRLGSLIDEILDACPDATVLVAQITPIEDTAANSRRLTYNAAIPDVVSARASQGKHVELVSMEGLTLDDLKDGLHPTDAGYEMMAEVWMAGIQKVVSNGWIKAPVGPEFVPPGSGGKGATCPSLPVWQGYGEKDLGYMIASGIGTNGDHVYHATSWDFIGRVASGLGNGTGVQLGDLDGDGKADYLWINPKNGALTAAINVMGSNTANFTLPNGLDPIYAGKGAPGIGVHMADIDGDGKVDYLYVSESGEVNALINGGPDSSSPGNWLWTPLDAPIASGAGGANQKNLIFADINGDGRADYIVKTAEGSLNVWLNFGTYSSAKDISWVPYGIAASGPAEGNVTILLADITGDGRPDYLIVDKDGGLAGYLNIRSANEGKPNWAPQGGSPPAAKYIASGTSTKPANIRMADMDGDGKADYIVVDADTGAITVYLNKGTADTSVIGDGIRFADMDGDGRDDYIFMGPQGELTVYLNRGANPAANNGWDWVPANNGKPIAGGIGFPRSQVILGDINNDGKADYCGVDKKTGALTCYANNGASSSVPTYGWSWVSFDDIGIKNPIASGLGPSKGVILADISGDGRQDYLWMDDDGSIPVYYKNAVGQIASNWVDLSGSSGIANGIGGARSAVRMADIDGDGRDDYLWVHTQTGGTVYYRNQVGIIAANWVEMDGGDEVASGIGSSGPNVLFADLNGDGRADYIGVDPASGAITAYQNLCTDLPSSGGGSGGGGGSAPTGGGGSSPTSTKPASSPTPTAPVLHCYNEGQVLDRQTLLDSIQQICAPNLASHFQDNRDYSMVVQWGWEDSLGGAVDVTLEIAAATSSCPTPTLSQADCVSQFTSIIDDCNTNTVTAKQGGTLTTDCLFFNIDPNLSTRTKPADDLNCYNEGQVLDRQALLDSIQQICTSDLASQLQDTRDYSVVVQWDWEDSLGGAIDVTLEIATATSSCPTLALSTLSQADCVSQFTSIIDDCNTNTVTAKQGGTLTTDCLFFNIDPNLSTRTKPADDLNCYNAGQTTSRTKLLDAAKQFCSDVAPSFDSSEVRQEIIKYAWDDDDNGGVDDDCVKYFTDIIDNCNTDTQTKKQGGTLTTDCLSFNIDPNLDPDTKPPQSCTPPPSADDRIAGRQILAAELIEISAGLFIEIASGQAATVVLADIANALATSFNPSGPKNPGDNDENCRLKFTTKGGGSCTVQTYPSEHSGNDSTSANTHNDDWNYCAWNNPASTAPPIQKFNDPGIGQYSIQFTATDEVAWSGANNTKKCVAQGLCNPILTFYRPCWNLHIYTWLTANVFSSTGYSDSWHGLCDGGDNEVLDQFGSGGDLLGDQCAIPCWNEASLPSAYTS
ncbi:hypothetical protein F5884DRAFT_904986 [Xylogone sp. PMI_703]|nr:hypothetical protein F5884DRAFT_904986 [Xylogone sp. PMI_703]